MPIDWYNYQYTIFSGSFWKLLKPALGPLEFLIDRTPFLDAVIKQCKIRKPRSQIVYGIWLNCLWNSTWNDRVSKSNIAYTKIISKNIEYWNRSYSRSYSRSLARSLKILDFQINFCNPIKQAYILRMIRLWIERVILRHLDTYATSTRCTHPPKTWLTSLGPTMSAYEVKAEIIFFDLQQSKRVAWYSLEYP